MAMYKGIYILSIKLSSCDKGRRSTLQFLTRIGRVQKNLFRGGDVNRLLRCGGLVHLKLTSNDKAASGQIVLTPVVVNDLI